MRYLDKQFHPSKVTFLSADNVAMGILMSYTIIERKHVNLTISFDSSSLKINIQKNLLLTSKLRDTI